MNLPPNSREQSAVPTSPDLQAHFRNSLKEVRAQKACKQCEWTGKDLSRHLQQEHGLIADGQGSAERISTAGERPLSGRDETQPATTPMQIDQTSPVSPATSTPRPPRRRLHGGGGSDRRVEGPTDPDFIRSPRPGKDNPSGPSRGLYDPRSDNIKQIPSHRGGQPQRGQRQSISSPTQRQTQRSSYNAAQPPLRAIQPSPRASQPPPQVQTQAGLASPTSRKAPVATPSPSTVSSTPQNAQFDDEEPEAQPEIILQPETRPISQEQLVAEVKGIYAGLVMVEAKCIEVDSKQAAAATQGLKEAPKLNNDQWQALIALHRTLLHEHHDFFLASQHPSAAPSLRKLATKYAMPARLWRHGIHSFLELLRHRLPDSFEHMLAFIYLAYSMIALLYETVPAFADTWVECLGDLGRYRMAIEEGDPRDREVWMNVSRFWYSKGTDRLPHVGRLYHHLAILARPNILQQLFFYCKALAVYQPFYPARESILTLFDPTALKEQDIEGNQSADATFVLLHSICFTFVNQDAFEMKKIEYIDLLEKKISAMKFKFKVPGVHIAVCGVTSLFGYNMKEGRLKLATSAKENRAATDEAEANYRAAQMQQAEIASKNNTEHETANLLPPGPVIDGYNPQHALSFLPPDLNPAVNFDISLTHAQDLAFSILSLTFEKGNDQAVQPHIHVWLVFLNYIKDYPEGMALIVKNFPWEQLARYATALLKKRKNDDAALSRIHDSNMFPISSKGFRPLPEEFMMRGLEIARRYFPHTYFNRVQVDDDERHLELPSMNLIREEKMLWLLVRFARFGPWLKYDQNRSTFTVTTNLKVLLQEFNNEPSYIQEPSQMVDDDTDMEMESPTFQAQDDDDSFAEIKDPQLIQLLNQKRDLIRKKQGDVITLDEEQNAGPLSYSSESFKPNITTLVIDTNSLLKHFDTFKNLLNSNQWSIVLPYSIVTELRGLQRNDGKISETSEAVLAFIQQSLQEKRNLRIITAKGSQINNISSQFYELIEDYTENGRKNLDDIIIETAKAQGEISAKRVSNDGITRPVVLITDDGIMRLKSISRGVASVSTKDFMKFISPVDEATLHKIVTTYHSLRTKHPKLDQNTVYQAARGAAGDEASAANILRRDMYARKQQAKLIAERQQGQHGVI